MNIFVSLLTSFKVNNVYEVSGYVIRKMQLVAKIKATHHGNFGKDTRIAYKMYQLGLTKKAQVKLKLYLIRFCQILRNSQKVI